MKEFKTANQQYVGRVELFADGSKVLFLDKEKTKKAPTTDEFLDLLKNTLVYVDIANVATLVTAYKRVSADKVELTVGETAYFLGKAA